MGATSTVDPDIKKALYTSLAYDELYGNKPSRLYNVIEEYNKAGILSAFGISLDKYMELSVVECTILVESAYKLNKEKDAAENAALKNMKDA